MVPERVILWGNCASQGDEVFFYGLSFDAGCSLIDTTGVHSIDGMIGLHDLTTGNPEFCEPLSCFESPTTGGDYRLNDDSPGLPENNDCGALIGAQEAGCGTTAVATVRFGQLKLGFSGRK